MNNDSEFQTKLIEYLEGCHIGEFLTGTMEDVKNKIPHISKKSLGIHAIHVNPSTQLVQFDNYQDPTLTLPKPPPKSCISECIDLKNWWKQYAETVDDLILRSNVHKCSASSSPDDLNKMKNNNNSSPNNGKPKGCINKDGICKARFPRDLYPETIVDASDGHISMKKREAMINTLSPCLTYLMRSNTDVSSMQSGTAMKAVILYVTEYISKSTLKTHQIFSSAYDVFDKDTDLTTSDIKPKDAARKLIMKMVNTLSSKMEIGSPMACMYLLGNPDHYTSHKFITCWWRSYVSHVQEYWINHSSSGIQIKNSIVPSNDTMDIDPKDETSFMKCNITNNKNEDHFGEDSHLPNNDNMCHGNKNNIHTLFEYPDKPVEETVILGQDDGKYVAMSHIDDYCFRPEVFSDTSLYDWIRLSVKRKKTKKKKNVIK